MEGYELNTPEEERNYRETMSRFATGVAVVTTFLDGMPHGSTIQALCSLSVSPNSLLISLNSKGRTLKGILATRLFCVNILSASQVKVAKIFSDPNLTPSQRFSSVEYKLSNRGLPVITGVLGAIECELKTTYVEADHTLVVGSVIESSPYSDGKPLVYYRRNYCTSTGLD